MFIKEIVTIEIDPTGLCNLACSFCPRATFYPNLNQHMSLEMAQLIVNNLIAINFTGEVSITGKGEPTLHNKFEELVKLFAGRSWSLKMNTNGKRFDKYKDTILKHFDKVLFNCYEYTREEYQAKVEELAEHKNVIVKWRPNNIQWFEDNPRYTNRGGSFATNNQPKTGQCDVVFTKLFIDYNGTYRLCCEDWKHELAMANIQEQSIEEYVENNPTLKQYRKMLAEGRRDIAPCNECVYSVADGKYRTTQEKMDQFVWLVKMEDLGA